MPDPRDQNRPIEHPTILLVEGWDEFALFIRLLDHLGIESIDIRLYEGKDNLRQRLAALQAASGFDGVTAVGILRDGDEDPSAAFQSVRSALSAAGFPSPEQPGEFTDGQPRIGVLIVPGDGQPGSLETPCWASKADLEEARQAPERQTERAGTVSAAEVEECVTAYVECLQLKRVRLHPNLDKVRVHAYLACQRKPGLKIGEAAEARYWNFNSDVWNDVKQFLQSM